MNRYKLMIRMSLVISLSLLSLLLVGFGLGAVAQAAPLKQGPPDLAITKVSQSASGLAGSTVTYTLTITGSSDLSDVVVIDTLPLSVSVISVSPPTSTQDSRDLGWMLGSVLSNTSQLITLVVKIDSDVSGMITNTATVTKTAINDLDLSNNTFSASIFVNAEADLSINKLASPNPVLVYDPLTYTLTITNNGPSDAVGVVVTDTLPAGMRFASASTTNCVPVGGDVACNLGNLTNGAVMTVKLMVTPTLTGTLTNTAVITSATTDPNSDNNTANAVTTVHPKADLVISKSDNNFDPVIAGTSLTYTLVVTNNGPSPAANVVVTDTLPLSVSVVSVTPATTTQNGQLLSWDLDTLPVNTPQIITVVVDVDGSARDTLANTATVTTTTVDPAPGNNSVTETTTVDTRADLSMTKSDSFDPMGLGVQIYTIQIHNSGPSDAFGVILTDTLPGIVSALPATSASQGSCSNELPVIICNLGKIADGNSATVTVYVGLNTPGIVTNTVKVTSDEVDPNGTNNLDAENTTVSPANLSVTKAQSSGPYLVNTPFTYTLTVTNVDGAHNYDATGVTLIDNLPSGVSVKSVSASQGSCSGTSVITCDLEGLISGDNATVTIVVTPTVVGLITNTASVTGNMPDLNTANNIFTLTTSISPVADLQVTKIANSGVVTAGNNLTYTLTVTNLGPSPATDVTVTDDLPDEVTFQSASPSCRHSGGIVTCNLPGSLAKNAVVTASIRVRVDPTTLAGPITNTVSVTGNEFDSNATNNLATTSTTVNRRADLLIAKTASSGVVAAGSNLTYTLAITNKGLSTATGVVVTDTLPTGVSFVSAAGCSTPVQNVGNVVTCTIAAPINNNNGRATASLVVRVDPAFVGLLTNTARITGAELDLLPADNSSTITTSVNRQTDLSITGTDSPDPILPGNLLTYNLIIVNNGPSRAVGVVVTQTLPAGVTFQSATPGQGNCTPGSVVTCTSIDLSPGGSATIAVVVKVDDSTAGEISSPAQISGGGGSDPISANNSTLITTFVGEFKKVFLPIITKSAPTELSVHNDNTGGDIIFTVVGTGVSCTVPNNTIRFCGSFLPGTYTVQVSSRCGSTNEVITFNSGPVTKRVFCR